MQWNYEMNAAPRDEEILALFEETCAIEGMKYDAFRVIIWDELEGEGWLDANEFDVIEGQPLAWVAIPEPRA